MHTRHRQRLSGHCCLATASSATAERQPDAKQFKRVTPAATTLPSPGPSGLDPGDESFTEEHRIRSYEVGPDQRTSIVTIANLLQEVAGNHGVAMWGRSDEGFATDPIMVENHLIFVTTRIQLRMKSYPKWGDLVSIKTWFQRDGRIAFERNWVIRNASTGDQLGSATSTWIMMNTQTRRPARIPDSMLDKLATFSPDQPKHVLPEPECKLKLPNFPMPAEITGPVQVARRSDVDMNQHLNNVTYLAWCLETVPLDVYTDCQLYQAEIDFKAECVAGDKVDCLGAVLSDADSAATNGSGTRQLLHMLQRCDAGGCRELVRCRTAWHPAPTPIAESQALGAAGTVAA